MSSTLQWPANAWAGTTVGLAKYLRPRLEQLVRVPAPIRFISYEPALGSIAVELGDFLNANPGKIGWLVAGGESGHGPTRPIVIPQSDWFRDLRDVCAAHGVAFYFKQWGGRTNHHNGPDGRRARIDTDYTVVGRWKLPILDGRTHAAFPTPSAEDLKRIARGFPDAVPIAARTELLPAEVPAAEWSPLRALGHKGKSNISWTDDIDKMGVTGCRRVSEECDNCYAWIQHDNLNIQQQRNSGSGKFEGYEHKFYERVTVSQELMQSTHLPAVGRLVFASAMSDVFINEVDHEHVERMIARIAQFPQHTFLVLSKRPNRIATVFGAGC